MQTEPNKQPVRATRWENKQTNKQGHAYISDVWCLMFSYFTSENMKIIKKAYIYHL